MPLRQFWIAPACFLRQNAPGRGTHPSDQRSIFRDVLSRPIRTLPDGVAEAPAVRYRESPASRAMVAPCQQRSVGENPRQLNHGQKIDFGEGPPADSSVGPVAFFSQISRCGNASPTTRAHRGVLKIFPERAKPADWRSSAKPLADPNDGRRVPAAA